MKTPWESRAVQVVEWVFVGVMVATAVGYALGWDVARVIGSWVPLGAVFTYVGARRVLVPRAIARQRREMEAMGFRVCPHCRYDLGALEAEGACPECGRAFNPETLVQDWALYFSAVPRR